MTKLYSKFPARQRRVIEMMKPREAVAMQDGVVTVVNPESGEYVALDKAGARVAVPIEAKRMLDSARIAMYEKSAPEVSA